MEHVIPGAQSPAGIALRCDAEGRIQEIFADSLGLAGCFPAGRLFSSCLTSASLAKSFSFLQKIRASQASFEWELQLAAEDGVARALYFDGCIVDGCLLILGAASSRELLDLLEDLIRIHNYQDGQVRRALLEMLLKEAAAGRYQHNFYNELSRVSDELANAHRELAKQNFELERANRLKNQFLGMVAHDLRNPVATILVHSDLLREDASAGLNEEQAGFVSNIQRSSEFMLQMIDELLDISSIEAGMLRLDRRPSDPHKLLEHTVGLNAGLARQKHIHVSVQIEGVLPRLSLDEWKIAQVLNNLISNAVKYSQPGTAVEVCAVAEDGGVRISIRDQGPGIPEAERGRLFQPFGRTSVRSTNGERSTGLGLAISRRIVEGHGGHIWVESQVGVGSVFIFTLPGSVAMNPV
jgi:signal transduction histidine kinase